MSDKSTEDKVPTLADHSCLSPAPDGIVDRQGFREELLWIASKKFICDGNSSKSLALDPSAENLRNIIFDVRRIIRCAMDRYAPQANEYVDKRHE